MRKEDYTDPAQYKRDKALEDVKDRTPVNPKLVSLCLGDKLNWMGENTSSTIGSCELSDQCTFSNDKISGVSGFCLKQVVGVDLNQQ